ncbi:MAG: hypothetical protein A2719_01330 [Candidatus Ryanbacteria bacterium RIFCSPHIGHO2_01_FULL_45_22]|uniref:Uncharacterized protein n=2 Tax=Candidatus Ryaniibacteriota TaxID=1817914 RepID=A0A1G2G054_9BACT|nr:MAG: hypothetical protein A2719_01330 [Candidatus Ryanbacteria bacterium RIFCSPHIGHO2_01_FULL_45_22]OGZ46367.1 MAG: hypothetical protein A3J54_04215 [Candidatus Ryanbacteria bacterium RIFCSPHIGHO2_02_FULL_45_13b]
MTNYEVIKAFLGTWSTKPPEYYGKSNGEHCVRFHCTNISYRIFFTEKHLTRLEGDQYPLKIEFCHEVKIEFGDTLVFMDRGIRVEIQKAGIITVSASL